MLDAQRLDALLFNADVWSLAFVRLVAHAATELAAEQAEEARRSDWDEANVPDPFE